MNHIRHDQQIVKQFSQQAESYAQLTASLAPTRVQTLNGLLQPTPEDEALEVCCGPGALALALAPAVKHVAGMDLTPAMLDQARQRQSELQIANVDWLTGDINNIPFEDARFAIVMCSAAFHHIEAPRRAFAEMVRVCKPHGRILIRDVTPTADKSRGYDAIEKLRDPSHVHALTIEELSELAFDHPVDEEALTTRTTSALSLDAILKTSFPEACSRSDIYRMLRKDAISGEDRHGLAAVIVEDQVRVSFRMTTAVWRKRA